MDLAPSTKVFSVPETRLLLKIIMTPKTQILFRDNKQHSYVWNYIHKCMKAKFPKFAKSTRQCYKKFENLKGKFYEIKRAQMNGEQRAYWLYWTEMEYITSQLPNQKPRFAIDANSRNSTAAKPLAATTSQKTNEHSNTTNLSRKTSETTLSNLQLLDSPATTIPLNRRLQLLTIIRDMKSMQSGKLIDGWEYALSKAQKKELFPLNKTWIDFYYEVWIAHLDDTIIKWEEFSTGKKIVRYDEADKLTFDIIKDEWNDFGNTSSIRIPTLRTLPAFIDKLKEMKTSLVLDESDTILTESNETENDESNAPFHTTPDTIDLLNNDLTEINKSVTCNVVNGNEIIHINDSDNDNNSLLNARTEYLNIKTELIKTKMAAYVEKHNRKCYKMDLELYKIEKDLGLPPSEYTKQFIQNAATNQAIKNADGSDLKIQAVNGQINNAFFLNLKREINIDDEMDLIN